MVYNDYRKTSGKWRKQPGSAVKIAVSPSGPWVVNKQGSIYRLVSGSWMKMKGCAKDIGAGADGSVWVIGCTKVGGGYSIHKWNGSNSWFSTNGGATNISVSGNGNPFVANSYG